MSIYLYGSSLFEENPKDFDLIIETKKNFKELLNGLKYTLNSFGGAKVIYKDKIFDIDIVKKLDNKLFMEKFAELDSDCVCYNLEYNKACYLEYYKSYKNRGYAKVINENSLHPKLGLQRREERINKANKRTKYEININNHLDTLKDFISKLNLKEDAGIIDKLFFGEKTIIKCEKCGDEMRTEFGLNEYGYWIEYEVCEKCNNIIEVD